MSKSSIGAFLSVLRKAKGMTQDEVAEHLGVSSKSVSSWENDRTCPDILLLPAIADLYGVSVDELVRGERNTREENVEQTQRINDTAMKKMRKNKLARFQQLRGIWTTVSVVGACFASIGVLFAFVWALVLAILGTCAFFVGIAFLVYQTKKYISSEGIAFPEDITEENSQFYISVMHGTILRILFSILPLAIIGVILLENIKHGTVVSVLIVFLLGIPLCAIVALLLWQRHLIAKYGTKEQKTRKKDNLKLFVLLTAVFVVIVIVANFLMMNVFFGLSHDYVKSNGEETYKTKEEFIRHLETLCVCRDIVSVNKELLIPMMTTFTFQLDEIKADILRMRESGYPEDDAIVERTYYDVGEGFVLEYVYIRLEETEYFDITFQDPTYEDTRITVQEGKVVTLHNEDGSTDLVLDLFHTNNTQSPGNNVVRIAKYPDCAYYYADSIAFLSKYEAEVYECRNGKYGVYVHTIYMVNEEELRFTSLFFAFALEALIYLVLRKKYNYIPVQKTLGQI